MASFLDVVRGLFSNNTQGNQNSYTPPSSGLTYQPTTSGGLTGSTAAINGIKNIDYAGNTPANNALPGILTGLQNGGLTLQGQPQVLGTETGGNGEAPGQSSVTSQTSTQTAAPVNNLQPYEDQARNRIQQIQQAYQLLNGNIDSSINDQAQQAAQNYGEQSQNLQKSYQNDANQLGGAYGARGLGDSSFYGAAQQDAGNTYQQGQQDITNAQNQTLAGLGQYGAQQKTAQDAALAQYNDLLSNLGQYDQAEAASPGAGLTGLQNLNQTLGTNLGQVQQNAAGIGTNASFLKGLSQFTPVQNQASNDLASKLQSLVTSGAPTFAKSQIAQGLIKQAQLTDPSAQGYWTNYFQNLLNGQQ